jgi:hypothetical protein
LIGPRDEEPPIVDTSVRPWFEIEPPKLVADEAPAARQPRKLSIRRFSSPPQMQAPPEKLERRRGLLSRGRQSVKN